MYFDTYSNNNNINNKNSNIFNNSDIVNNNNILCYILSARKSLNNGQFKQRCLHFYSKQQINDTKSYFLSINKETSIQRLIK